MANYEATKYDFSGANLTGIQGVNTGLVVPWGDSSVPSGFLECNGQAVSRTTYADLFAVISTTYGVGDGSTTFNVPDLTDRVIVHSSPTKALASTGGANTVASTGNVGGTVGNTTLTTPTIAAHTHPNMPPASTPPARVLYGTPETPPTGMWVDSGQPIILNPAGGGGAHLHPASATFTGDATSVLQPYSTVMYIIKT